MRLTLSTLRCPDSVAPETRSTGGGEFTMGRAPDNSWVLADPDRHLSKRHCVLAFRSGGWQIADTSTNGTFLNRDAEPIGQGSVRDLRDGDRIRLGAYEIEVRIEEDAVQPAQPMGLRGGGNPFDDDPFAPVPLAAPPPAETPLWRDNDPLLPADFDPLAPAEPDPFKGPSIADHSAAVSDAFRPPAVMPGGGLPDDWDLDEPLLPPVAPAAAAPPPPIAAPPVTAFAAPAAAATPGPASVAPPPPEPPDSPPANAGRALGEGGLPTASTPADTLLAFLRGAGVPNARLDDPAATMHDLGAAFRALVAGLRAVLIARAAIKGEFRIEQTMIRAKGNNPLKFSADDDDALAALLGVGRRTGMAAADSVAEALRDIRLHELASVAAMQKAVRDLLAQLSPEAIQASAGSGLLPVQKKARAFEAFEAQHAALVSALADDFDSAFGKAFARAYEEALRDAAARQEE
jgi:type VI secretion system protein ImpI/type VI secretion system protein